MKWRQEPVELDAGAAEAAKGRMEAQLKRATVFPNPYKAGSGMKVVIDNIFPDCTFVLSDAAGKKVIEQSSGKRAYIEWDGMLAKDSPAAPGSYSYVIKTKDGLEKEGKIEIK